MRSPRFLRSSKTGFVGLNCPVERRLPSLLTFSLPAPVDAGCRWLLTFPVTCGHFAEKARSRNSRLAFCIRKARIESTTFVHKIATWNEKENRETPPLDKGRGGCCLLRSIAAAGGSSSRCCDPRFRPNKTRLVARRDSGRSPSEVVAPLLFR